jgi:WD40 repeat protein
MRSLSPLDVPAEVCSAGSRTATVRTRNPICWKAVGNRVLPWAGGAVAGALAVSILWMLLGGRAEPAPQNPNHEQPPVALAPAADPGPAPKLTLQGELGAVWAVAFLPHDRLMMGLENGTVKIWNLQNGEAVKTLERQKSTVWSADVSPDGKFMVTACDDSSVALWNLETLATRPELSFPQRTSTKAAVFSPVGKFLATGDRGASVRVWDWSDQVPVDLNGQTGTVHALAYSPDGTRLASADSDGTVRVWNLKEIDWPARRGAERSMELAEHRGAVYGVAFSPDGTKIASAGWDGYVRIWDATNGTQIKPIRAHDSDVWSVSFGNGGKWVASASDGSVKVWEVDTGKEVFSYRGPPAFHVVRFAPAPNDTTLAAGGRDGNVRVWEVKK